MNLINYKVLINFIDGDQLIGPLIEELVKKDCEKNNYDYKELLGEVVEHLIRNNQNLTDYVREFYFADLYSSLYEYCFRNLKENSSVGDFYVTALETYKKQQKLNYLLDVETKAYDRFLIGCVIGELAKRFPDSYAMKYERTKLLDSMIEHFRFKNIEDNIEDVKQKKLNKKLF